MTTRRRTRTAATLTGLASIAMALSACGGKADAEPTGIQQSDIDRIAAAASHQASASASAGAPSPTSASASPADYTVPEAAKAHTKEGAKAFVEFYWKTLDSLDAHPEEGVIDKLTTSSCTSCRRQRENVSYLHSHGLHAQALGARNGIATVRADSTADSVVVQTTYDDLGAQNLSGSKVVQTFPATKGLVETRADWSNGGWRIGAIGIKKK